MNLRVRPWIETVTGPIVPSDLGPTTAHDHVFIDIRQVICRSFPNRSRSEQPITPDLFPDIERNWIDYTSNLVLSSVDVAIEELSQYREAGGRSIVEPTPIGVGRDATRLADASRSSGVNIIMGTGYYVDVGHPPHVADASDEQLAALFVRDLNVGVDSSSIRSGFIGELGCSWPLRTSEEKVLRAGALAQQETDVALMIHPGRHHAAPWAILELVTAVGTAAERIILAHVERTLADAGSMADLASTGCWLSFDLFGVEEPYYCLEPSIRMPTDDERLHLIADLLERGHGSQILLGQDVCAKHRLSGYGGRGYRYLMDSVRPRMRTMGFSEEDIFRLLELNPQRAFSRG